MIPKKATKYYAKNKHILDLAISGKDPHHIANTHNLDSQKVREIISYARRLGINITQNYRGPKVDIPQRVLQLVREGKSRSEIAKVTPYTPSQLSKLLTIARKRKVNIKSIQKEQQKLKQNQVKQLYLQNLSIKQISLLTGLPKTSVSKKISELVKDGQLKRRRGVMRFLRNQKQKNQARGMEIILDKLIETTPALINFLSSKKGANNFEKLIRTFGELGFTGKPSFEQIDYLATQLSKHTNTPYNKLSQIVFKTLNLFFYKG
jgi:DNA-binding MarR family transcriptional regulator